MKSEAKPKTLTKIGGKKPSLKKESEKKESPSARRSNVGKMNLNSIQRAKPQKKRFI